MKHFIALTSALAIASLLHAAKTAPDVDEGQVYDDVELTNLHYDKVESLPASLRIEAGSAKNRDIESLLGINWNWWRTDEIAWSKQEELNPVFIELLSELPMGLNRMTGSASQTFKWKDAIGPIKSRATQPEDYFGASKPYGIPFGIPEWIKAQQAADPSVRCSFVFNFLLDTPEDAADMVAYMTLPAESGNKWALQRVADGIKDPFPPTLWELGNELDHNKASLYDEKQYVAECKRWIAAIKAVQPDIKLSAHIKGSPWNKKRNPTLDEWRKWHRHVLAELKDDIDYLAFHPYYKDGSIHNMDFYIGILERDILEVTGTDRIKVILTEHGTWPDRLDKHPNNPNKRPPLRTDQTHNWSNALTTSDFLIRIIKKDAVAAANYHSLRAGPWALIDTDDKGHLYPTAMHETLAFWKRNATAQILDLQLTEADSGGTLPSLQALAFENGNEIRLIVLNKHPYATREIELEATAELTITEIESLQNLDGEAINDLQGKAIQSVTKSQQETAKTFSAPPLSLIRLTLSK